MKRISLGIIALAITFSTMAQKNNSGLERKNDRKELRQKRLKGGEDFEKLNLSDAQKTQMKTINESFRQQMQDLRKQGSITVDQQKQKREALVKERKEKIAAILTPAQRDQVENYSKDFKNGRNDGMRAGRFGDITKHLNLTADQSAKISSLNSTFRTNLQHIRQNTSLSSNEKRQQMTSLMKQHKADMEALLTEDQKDQLKSRHKNRPNRTAVK